MLSSGIMDAHDAAATLGRIAARKRLASLGTSQYSRYMAYMANCMWQSHKHDRAEWLQKRGEKIRQGKRRAKEKLGQ
jgi:hypothetical protein